MNTWRLGLILLLSLWLDVGGTTTWAQTFKADYQDMTLQNATTTNVAGSVFTVDRFTSLSLDITISGTATVNFEAVANGAGTMTALSCVNTSTETAATTTTATGLYQCNVAALNAVQARTSGNTGTVTVKARASTAILGSTGVWAGSATGGAPPATAVYAGALSSGATGGLLAGFTACDLGKPINISTATTTLMITGVSGRQVRICNFHMITALANNVAWIEGTGATCGTGTIGMAGGTTAASGYNYAANNGIALGSGLGEVLTTTTAGDSVCLVTSASTQLSGYIKYTIY